VNAKNSDGDTPLLTATNNNNPEIIALLNAAIAAKIAAIAANKEKKRVSDFNIARPKSTSKHSSVAMTALQQRGIFDNIRSYIPHK
jgi:hypothetical protein